MNTKKLGWIGAIGGATLGVTVAFAAVVYARYGGPASPETHTLLAWAGGIGGSFIGVLGGVVGTYCSIRNTQGPRERALMIRASVLCWLFVLTFLFGLFLLPSGYNQLLWIPYALGLGFGIRWCNQEHARIRREESGQVA